MKIALMRQLIEFVKTYPELCLAPGPRRSTTFRNEGHYEAGALIKNRGSACAP